MRYVNLFRCLRHTHTRLCFVFQKCGCTRNAELTNYADKEYGGGMVHMYGGSVVVGFLVDVGALERVVRQAVAMVQRGRNGVDVEW